MSWEWENVEGDWDRFKTNIKQHWDKLTDEHLVSIAGKRSLLVKRIQEAYGISHEEAEEQIRLFEGKNRSTDGANSPH
ncbi:hypothetical protein [Paludibacterium yongneupense]|uniref:hypothetical protein n=1 Tax=Paludibacterium yongneupense TaxID=400061 RepID=UPI000410948E|nr:hypothetical protein [Paludibacterium yongneupense]